MFDMHLTLIRITATAGQAIFKLVTYHHNAPVTGSVEKTLAAGETFIFNFAGANDEHLLKPWSLLAGGKTIFTLPRIAVLRSSILNHAIHHRAQLGVYLRLNDVAVPAIYGPSADEGQM